LSKASKPEQTGSSDPRWIPRNRLPFDVVRDRIAERLRAEVEQTALRQYISALAGKADIQGADLNGTKIPLVQ
jgi:peptidyl-prolyl cis-trans isomerase C